MDNNNARSSLKYPTDSMNGGGKTISAKCDVTKLDDVEAMFKKADSEFGRIDVLVNNVGWDQPLLFTETTPEFWNKVITINVIVHTTTPFIILHRIDARIFHPISKDSSKR